MKYLDIRTVSSGRNAFGIPDPSNPEAYQVWIGRDGTMTCVTRDEKNQLSFNRKAVGLRVKKGYRPPTDPPGLFTHEEAVRVAHQIGRYFLGLGDLVYAYTTVDGLINHAFFDEV